MSLTTELQAILSSKAAIKQALVDQGLSPTDDFSTYPGLVASLSAGGGTDPGGTDDFTNAQIGDLIGGGVYAGINTESDNSQYHIVFGLQESEIGPGAESRWKTSRTGTLGTDSETDGWANTEAMVAAGVADHPAAQYCTNYTDAAGNSDYYLPSRAELALEENLRGHPELSTNTSGYRWSSWQVTNSGARGRRFLGGQELTIDKDITSDGLVRPVRRVAV